MHEILPVTLQNLYYLFLKCAEHLLAATFGQFEFKAYMAGLIA